MNIDKTHKIVGRKHSEIKTLDIGSLYPVLDSENETVIGVYSAEFGTPHGYELDESKQAFVQLSYIDNDLAIFPHKAEVVRDNGEMGDKRVVLNRAPIAWTCRRGSAVGETCYYIDTNGGYSELHTRNLADCAHDLGIAAAELEELVGFEAEAR